MKEVEKVPVTNKTKGNPLTRGLPFDLIKQAVLGKRYELSVVLAGRKLSQNLNRTYRHSNKPANVLAFPLSKDRGEIVLCPRESSKEAPGYGYTAKNFIVYLFIHGLLHLKGYTHGSTMETEEKLFYRKFIR